MISEFCVTLPEKEVSLDGKVTPSVLSGFGGGVVKVPFGDILLFRTLFFLFRTQLLFSFSSEDNTMLVSILLFFVETR